jgi:hypothetical protein
MTSWDFGCCCSWLSSMAALGLQVLLLGAFGNDDLGTSGLLGTFGNGAWGCPVLRLEAFGNGSFRRCRSELWKMVAHGFCDCGSAALGVAGESLWSMAAGALGVATGALCNSGLGASGVAVQSFG